MARRCSYGLDRALAFCFAIMLVIAANTRVGGCALDGFKTVRLVLIAIMLWSKEMYLLSSLAYAYALARYGDVSWQRFS